MQLILGKKNYQRSYFIIKNKRLKNLSIGAREDFFSLPDFPSVFRKIADFCIGEDIDLKIYNIPFCFMLGYKRYLRFDKNKKFVKLDKCKSCLFFQECPGIIKNDISFLGGLIVPVQRGLTDLEKCMLKIINIENGIPTERVLKLAKRIKICASCTSEGEVFRVTDRLIKQGIIKREFKKGKYIWSLM